MIIPIQSAFSSFPVGKKRLKKLNTLMKVTEIVDSETESYLGPNSSQDLSPCIQICHRFGKDIASVGGK